MELTPEMCIGGRDLSEPRLSPDGALVAFGVRWEGSSAIVVVDADGGPERLVTSWPPPATARGLGGGCFGWLPDGSAIVYVAVDGSLWWQPVPGGPPRLVARHDGRGVAAPVVTPDGSSVVYVVDTAEIWICGLAPGSVPRRLDDATADFCLDPCVSPDGSTVSWQAWDVPDMPWDASRIEHVDLDDGGRHRTRGAGAIQQPGYLPDGRRVWVRDDHGWLNVWIDERPAVEELLEHAGPTWGPGQRSYAVSPDASMVAFTRNEAGFGRLCVVHLDTGAVETVGRGVHGQLSWHGDRLVALRSGARTPTQIVVHDTRAGDQRWSRRVVAVGPLLAWDAAELPEPVPFTVEHDGATLHARRYVAGHGRTICWAHGGPTDQWQVEFNPRVAYWWSRGWDVLVPDPRGTTGHGRAYQQSLHGGFGALDAGDAAAILRASHERGWSTPSRTVLMGGSSGGTVVLGVLGLHPGLACAGVALYPVSELADLHERSHRFEAHYMHSLVGPLDDTARYRERSPVTYAERIDVPLLLIHGDQDPVVPVEHSIVLADRIRAAGGRVELHLFDGEGHGFRQREHRLAEYELVGRFLHEQVGLEG